MRAPSASLPRTARLTTVLANAGVALMMVGDLVLAALFAAWLFGDARRGS